MRVFLDANVMFSAAKTDGAVRQLLARLHSNGHVLVADDYVVAEARRNLASKKAEATSALQTLLGSVHVAAYKRSELTSELKEFLPEKDRPVLAAAIRLQCDALVTGDKTHFGPLYGRSLAGVRIHSPRSLADAFNLF